jgi:hypothetical protein
MVQSTANIFSSLTDSFYLEDGGDNFLRIVGPFQRVSLLTASVGMLLQS